MTIVQTDTKNTLAESPDKSGMTSQQRHFTEVSGGRFAKYRQFVVGEGGWPEFIGFEFAQLVSCNLPGFIGYGLRSLLLKPFFSELGKGALLGKGLSIRQPRKISLGRGAIIDDFSVLDVRSGSIAVSENVFVGRSSILSAKGGEISIAKNANISSNCRIATQSNVEIGESVLISAYCYIGPGNHSRDESDDRPLIEREMEIKDGVNIGANAWIGARATILDGVTIGEGAIVGAHSLVVEDVPANTTVAGTPAKPIIK